MEPSSVHSPSPMSLINPISPPPPHHPYYYHHSSSDVSRPSLGFPLGTALLLVVIFTLSGVFSCCYHWDKFRSLRQSYAAAAAAADLENGGGGGGASTDKAKASLTISKEGGLQSVPVIMPGEQTPRFIALPCPCAPPHRLEQQVEEDDEKVADVDTHAPPKPTSPSSSSTFVPTTAAHQ